MKCSLRLILLVFFCAFVTPGDAATDATQTTFVSVSAASYDGAALAPEFIVAGFGSGLATTQAAVTLPLPTTLAGVTVRVRDSAGSEREAPLFDVEAWIEPAKIGIATLRMPWPLYRAWLFCFS